VTARATFLCLCKETWRKETHPACAPDAARRVRGAGGIFRGGILPPRKTPHIHVRRPAGLIRRPRRYGGAPKINININGNSNSNSNSNININGNGNGNGTNRRPCRSGGSRELLILIL